MSNLLDYPRRSKRGEPVWELATEYPIQGTWTEKEYLRLTDSRRGIEFNAGTLDFLPMPTRTHQEIIFWLCSLLKAALNGTGDCWLAGIRVRTHEDKIREPDTVAMLDRNDPRAGERLFEGAGLVCEVVSDAPALTNASTKRSAPNTNRRAYPNTGSLTQSSRSSPCSPFATAGTLSIASRAKANSPVRR